MVLRDWEGLLVARPAEDLLVSVFTEEEELTRLSGAAAFLFSVRTAELEVAASVERAVLFVVAPMVRGADLVLLTPEERDEVSRRWYSDVPLVRAEVPFTCEFPSVRVAVLPFAEATVLVYRSEPALRVSGREYVDL